MARFLDQLRCVIGWFQPELDDSPIPNRVGKCANSRAESAPTNERNLDGGKRNDVLPALEQMHNPFTMRKVISSGMTKPISLSYGWRAPPREKGRRRADGILDDCRNTMG